MKLLLSMTLVLISLSSGIVYADETDDARAVALNILETLEQRKNAEVWETSVSTWFKDKMTREAFLANMTVIQSQLGGKGTGRHLIQQNTSDSNAQYGYTGKVYSFMFGTRFPAANVYEMIVMMKEGNAYRLSGINYTPNPN